MVRFLAHRNLQGLLLLSVVVLLLAAGFVLSPIATGDDWETFYGAAWHVLTGRNLFSSPITFTYYSNPPWVAIALIPLSLLPFRWGWGIVCSLSFLAILAISRRWHLGLIKTILAMLSPSMLYIALHGQIDLLLLSGILLPVEWWLVLALAKPQVTIGLMFGIPSRLWIRALLIFLGVFSLSVFLLGFWLPDWILQPHPFSQEAHNLWLGLWPFQVPVGVALLLKGISRSDEKLLVAASPFLFPYATTSSLIGPWLAVSAFLKDWQIFLVWLSWWGAVLYRGLGGV